MRRALIYGLAAILVLLVVVLLGGWLFLRGSLPKTSGTVTNVAGLAGPVEIVRDANGVPHIFAESDLDAVFGLGYVHAQDRLWQMEMNRRIGNGELSEVLGEATLEIDKYQRTMGYRRAAEAAWPGLTTLGQEVLEAYAAGVNAWLSEGRRLPPEFLILGFEPKPWSVYDSLVWVKMMQYDLGGDYELELLRARLTSLLGPERAAQILPAYPEDGINILPPDALDTTMVDKLFTVQNQIRDRLGLTGIEQGSNNWVVAGSRTETGLPMLANDPHLAASIPAIWYLAEVQGDRLHVTGASFPAVPLFPTGHNDRIAWGVTNVNPDVQDLYIERINPANPNEVEVNGAWAPMEIFSEQIVVDGREEPVAWAARWTRHGPLISDVQSTNTPVSLRWTALDDDDTTLDSFLQINYAQSWEEFREALRLFVAPSQNFVYADVDGNIGYMVPGRIPIRRSGDGMLPTPGWNDETAWEGWIPFDELPQSFNPVQGYIANGNNRVVGDEYPYLIGNDWSEPFRAERIVELIEQFSSGGETISMEDMATIQRDQASAQVRTLLPFLTSLTGRTEREQQAIDLLRSWDGVAGLESTAAAIYIAWRIDLEHALIEDDLSSALFEEMRTRSHPLFVQSILEDDELGAIWCDNVRSAAVEDCATTALSALDRALVQLTEAMGPQMDRWQWGEVHKTQYPHRPFSDVAMLRPFFHRSIANGGDDDTVNVAPVRRDDLYHQYHVPGYRHLINLAALNNSRFIITTGQSGNPLSGHYGDFIEPHRDTTYLPMTFGREEVSGDLLRLEPGGQ
jgi:penicillin amidase